MPRPNEIATDARALYGPPSVRPAAGDMGDGALWVDPGDAQSLWQVQSGNWRQIALPPTDDDSSIPVGVPVLRGPYVVDFGDIAHDGDTKVLWTPRVGDVLLMLASDHNTAVPSSTMSAGGLNVGTAADPLSIISGSNFDQLHQLNMSRDMAYAFTSASPVQVGWQALGDADLTDGHVELYALVARAVAP